MNEKEGFDKIVEALEHQSFIINRHYRLTYNSCQYIINFCRHVKCFDVFLFIREVGVNNIQSMKLCKDKFCIKLKIEEVKSYG